MLELTEDEIRFAEERGINVGQLGLDAIMSGKVTQADFDYFTKHGTLPPGWPNK